MVWFKDFFRDMRKAIIVSLKCPLCRQIVDIKDKYLLGSIVLCPACHAEIVVPSVAPEKSAKNPGKPESGQC